MEQYTDVQAEMPGGWHSPTAYINILGDGSGTSIPTIDRFLPHVGNQAAFTRAWERCSQQRNRYNEADDKTNMEAFYPPGQCAAQQVVLLALDHGCRPIGLTERWYNSSTPGAKFPGEDLFMRKAGPSGKPGPKGKAAAGLFGSKDAVPPCGTCDATAGAGRPRSLPSSLTLPAADPAPRSDTRTATPRSSAPAGRGSPSFP